MSAWIVDKKHIDLMVAAVAHGTRDGVLPPVPDLKPGWENGLGQMLTNECVASVRYRYPDDKPGEEPGPTDGYYLKPYAYEHPGYLPTAAELYKACACYGYQSCEHPGWKESGAYKFCEKLEQHIAARVPDCRRMRQNNEARIYSGKPWAEYEAAPWGFDEESIAECKGKQRAELCRAINALDGIPDGVLWGLLQERGVKTTWTPEGGAR